jgi:hypothetical protein
MEEYQKTFQELFKAVQESTDFAAVIQEFAYQGFDPLVMAKELKERADAASPKRNLQKDVRLMITLAVTRGTNVDKVVKKMSESGAQKVKALSTAYGLVSSSKSAGPKTISLSRVVATFPQVAAQIIAKNPGSNARLASLNPDLPEYLCFPGANALIPKTGEMSPYQTAYNEFAEQFSQLVNSSQKESERQNFIAITRDSPITGQDDQRRDFLNLLASL